MASGLISLAVGVGGSVLSSLFRPKQKDTFSFGPRVSDLNVPTVSPGNEINRVWGEMKVNTQYIWTSRLIETMHIGAQRASGGKGGGKGGGSTNYTISYTYSVNVAIGVCRGPVVQCNRIWAAGKLMWTNPNQVKYIQSEFDAAYQAETSRLLDLGVPVAEAHVSGYFFAYNAYMEASTLTIWSLNSVVTYIMDHPVNSSVLNYWDIYGMVNQLFDPVSYDKKYVPTPIRYDSVVVYNGDELQEPDPTLQAALGANNVPGYRGLCWIMINNLQLADFGNTVPQFTVEVMKDGTVSYASHLVAAAAGQSYAHVTGISGWPPERLSDPSLLEGGSYWTTHGSAATQYITDAQPKDVTLIQIISDILTEAGLPSSVFDVTTAIPGDITVQGYAITQTTSTRQVLQDLQKIFAFDGCESGYKIKFKMLNERPRVILRREDFGAHIDTDDLPTSIEQTRASELDMPRRINFRYQEPERNYSMNSVWAERQVGSSKTVEDIDVTVAMHRAQAKKLIEEALAVRFRRRNTYKISLPRKYIVLEPGDVALVAEKDYANEWFAIRLIEMTIGANGLIEATFCDADFRVDDLPSIIGEDLDVTSPAVAAASRTYAYLLDMPIPSDIIPDGPQFFAVLTGVTAGWKSGGLLVDLSDPGVASAFGSESQVPTQGSSWYQVAVGQVQVPHGVAMKTLDSTVKPGTWDYKSEVIVYLMNPSVTLSNADPVDMMTQALNVCYIGGEICAFANAENLGNGKWRLTKFMRGLRGTDYAMADHAISEKFVMLTQDAIERVVETPVALGKKASYIALSSGESLTQESEFTFTNTGNALRPYAPAITSTTMDEANNSYITWQPRNRLNGRWQSGADITLDQDVEAYEIDVITLDGFGDEVIHATYSLSSVRSWTYLATAQVADTGISGAGIILRIYQIGAIIGRGFSTKVTL